MTDAITETISVSSTTAEILVSSTDRTLQSAFDSITISEVSEGVTITVENSASQITESAAVSLLTVGNPSVQIVSVATQGPAGIQGAKGDKGDPGVGSITAEVPSGAVDGSNRIFTLSSTPITNSLLLFVNGLMQIVGYTLAGATVTFDSDAVPHTGDHVFAQYSH